MSALAPHLAWTAVAILALAAPVAAAPLLPDFAAATFTPGQRVDNPFFPLLDRRTHTYVGRETATGRAVERFELTNLRRAGPTILGVTTAIQFDRAFEDGRVVEETHDYYAQDDAGDVWYFGEDVTNFRYDADGNLIGTDNSSAWRAGVNGALPGWIMPAAPAVGLSYYQEFAAFDEALDQALVIADDVVLATIRGLATGVLVTFETTDLDPLARGLKYYVRGFGLVREDEDVDGDLVNPKVVFELVDVPAPAALALFGPLFAALLVARRRSRPA